MGTVLVIDDNETMREGCAAVAKRLGHRVFTASGGAEGISKFRESGADLVISDLRMDKVDGLEVIKQVKAAEPDTLVMLITAFGDVETAVEAMKLGAWDFVTKPFTPELLRGRIEKAFQLIALQGEQERLRERNRLLEEEARESNGVRELLGGSEAMTKVWTLLKKVAATDTSVLITGESGTGKELVARAIHENSRRTTGPFIKVSCGALAETLLESELFGHEKGAFTGAIRKKLGRFELADGGTIFLDEIGDISQSIQMKLLRVLQEHEIERVGGEETIKVDVRVLSATNKDLQREVSEGRFREDLYYRLHIVPVKLPPLRERREDIPELVRHFIGKLGCRTGGRIKGISEVALARLRRHTWPGNVRELENVIEHAMVFSEGESIREEDLPPGVGIGDSVGFQPDAGRGAVFQVPEGEIDLDQVLEGIERRLIDAAYRKAGGVKAETARLLGVKPSALYYKLEKYGIGSRD
jgi:two-component system response regulator HydG